MKRIGVIGSFVVDLTARCNRLPSKGETTKGCSFKAGAGGKGSNQTIAAARLGRDVLFSTKLGNDEYANYCINAVNSEKHLNGEYIFRTAEASTGIALISVSEESGDNQIVVVPGACETYSDEDIKKLEPLLDSIDILLLQLEINMDATEKLIKAAYDKSIKVILNPAPAAPLKEELYRYLYLVTPNESEAESLSGIKVETDEDAERAAKWFMDKGVENVIITLGKKGSYLYTKDFRKLYKNYPLKAIDTTGAGDSFNGALLAYLSDDMPLKDAVSKAMAASNISVTRKGTSAAMPTEEEVEELIEEYGLL